MDELEEGLPECTHVSCSFGLGMHYCISAPKGSIHNPLTDNDVFEGIYVLQ